MNAVAGVQCFGGFLLIIVCFRSEGSRVRSGWGLEGSGNVLSPECLNRVAEDGGESGIEYC